MLKKRIRMLRNGKGSPDGLRIEDYQKDGHYTVPFDLAEGFRRAGYAVIEGDAEAEPAAEAEPEVAAPVPVRAPEPAPAPPPPPIEASAPDKPSVSMAVPAAVAVSASAPAVKAPRRPRTLSGKQDRSLSSTEA